MSLNIEKQISDATTLVLSGRLDTGTAPSPEAEPEAVLSDTTALVPDMAKLEYISSAGLRVILKAQKAMNTKGTGKLVHVSESMRVRNQVVWPLNHGKNGRVPIDVRPKQK